MKTPILLHIPLPCHENWDAMTQAEKGRHCNSCNKIVVDFSVMSDRQVLDYFKTTTGNTCGRFYNDQLQRPLLEQQQQPSKWSYFLASIIGFIMSSKLMAQQKYLTGKVAGNPILERVVLKGDTVKPKEKQVVIKNSFITGGIRNITIDEIKKVPEVSIQGEVSYQPQHLNTLSTCNIFGGILDEKNHPIAGATISIKDTKFKVFSTLDGAYEFNGVRVPLKITLVVSSIGFETKEIEISPRDKQAFNIFLKETSTDLNEVVVQSPYGTNGSYTTMGGAARIYSKTTIHPPIKDSVVKIIQKIFNKEAIKIYPNPAPKNSIIQITIKNAEKNSLHFFDNQSRLLTVKDIVTNSNNQTTEFPLPAMFSSGIYFISIINETTKKQVTEKLIVE